jgi:endonuclease/exonuclease/phosphatase family metal-dependent hydrolase
MESSGSSPVVVATWNLHAGINGYGRRFDFVEACRALGADVLILQEVFAPIDGASQADEVCAALGYEHRMELPMSRAWRIREEIPAPPAAGWEPQRPYQRSRRALRVGSYFRGARVDEHRYEPGTWGLAILAREPIVDSEAIELGKLKRDYTFRTALSVTLRSGLHVIAAHMAHSTHGSPRHFRTLRRALPGPEVAAVLGGDLNFWGPPIEVAMPGWRRAAVGRTWPSYRPVAQLDHLFVTRSVAALGGEAVAVGNSDHLPLRARIDFAPRRLDPIRGRRAGT